MSPSSIRASRPRVVLVAAALESLEAVGLLVLAVIAAAAGPGSDYPLTAYGVGGTLLLAAALLGLVAFGTYGLRPWARTPGIVWQLVQLLVGLYALQGQGSQPGVALLAVVPAAVVIVLLVSKPSREALARSTGG